MFVFLWNRVRNCNRTNENNVIIAYQYVAMFNILRFRHGSWFNSQNNTLPSSCKINQILHHVNTTQESYFMEYVEQVDIFREYCDK